MSVATVIETHLDDRFLYNVYMFSKRDLTLVNY